MISRMTITRKAMILGCGGTRLSAVEKDFFRAVQPWGFILFRRNIESLTQVKALTDENARRRRMACSGFH
nr:hypothetical protein [Marinicella sp. W31]MDC2877518.1 hypothetical protein [Marinicella sp. W31]